MKTKKGNIFLISFLPAMAYWYLEAYYPIKIALMGGILLSVLEVSFEKIYYGHVHQISKLNFFLIIFLGSLSLFEEDGVWFKMQPTFSMWAMSFYMIYKNKKGRGLFNELMEELSNANQKQLPEHVMKSFEKNIIILFLIYGLFMAVLAIWSPTSYWAFFKTAGFLIIFLIFGIIQMFWMRKDLKS